MRTDIDQVSGGRVEPAACSAPRLADCSHSTILSPLSRNPIAQASPARPPPTITTSVSIPIRAPNAPLTSVWPRPHGRLMVRGKPGLLLNKARPSCLLRQIAADRRAGVL